MCDLTVVHSRGPTPPTSEFALPQARRRGGGGREPQTVGDEAEHAALHSVVSSAFPTFSAFHGLAGCNPIISLGINTPCSFEKFSFPAHFGRFLLLCLQGCCIFSFAVFNVISGVFSSQVRFYLWKLRRSLFHVFHVSPTMLCPC